MSNKISKSMLALLLCVSMTLGISAHEPLVVQNSEQFQIQLLIEQMVSGISEEKGMYGLENVDLNDLYIGTHIPSYEVIDGTYSKINNVMYFPLIENGVWVATATVCKTPELVVNISTAFVDYFIGIDSGTEVALVFDKNGAYAFHDYTFDEILQYELNEDRDAIEQVLTRSAPRLETAKIEIANKLQMPNPMSYHQETRADIPRQMNILVPLQVQKYPKDCWATSTYVIASHFKKTTASYDNEINHIYDMAGVPKYDMGDARQADYVLINRYGLTTTINSYNFNLYTVVDAVILEKVMFASTLRANASSSTPNGHALTVRGYMLFDQSTVAAGGITYMNSTTGRYEASSVGNDLKLVFIEANGAYFGDINALVVVDKP